MEKKNRAGDHDFFYTFSHLWSAMLLLAPLKHRCDSPARAWTTSLQPQFSAKSFRSVPEPLCCVALISFLLAVRCTTDLDTNPHKPSCAQTARRGVKNFSVGKNRNSRRKSKPAKIGRQCLVFSSNVLSDGKSSNKILGRQPMSFQHKYDYHPHYFPLLYSLPATKSKQHEPKVITTEIYNSSNHVFLQVLQEPICLCCLHPSPNSPILDGHLSHRFPEGQDDQGASRPDGHGQVPRLNGHVWQHPSLEMMSSITHETFPLF